jgi:hypothetical protein
MKSIYDEAIEHVKNGEVYLFTFQVIQALERAKKEHELLELYRDFHYGNHDAETDHDILRQIKAHEEELK